METKRIEQTNTQATLAAFITLPIIIITTMIAVSVYGMSFFKCQDNAAIIIACLINLVVCVPHELLHAAGFMFGGKKWNELEFGINLPISVFIRFKGEMSMKAFRIGVVMPFVFTALIPMIVGAFSGCFLLYISGVMQATACGSDLLSLIQSIRFDSTDKVVDIEGCTGFAVIQ